MARLPVVTGRQVLRVLQRGGFSVLRVKGSHHFVRHDVDPTRQTVVPVHGNEDLGRPILRKILQDVSMSIDDFIALL